MDFDDERFQSVQQSEAKDGKAALSQVSAVAFDPYTKIASIPTELVRVDSEKWSDAGRVQGRRFDKLCESIESTHGNCIPVAVLERSDGAYDLIYGRRRLEACSKLGLHLNALVYHSKSSELELDDLQLAEGACMEALPDFYKGMHWARLLSRRSNKSKPLSLRALASVCGVSHSTIANAVKLATLPSEVLNAFPDLRTIPGRLGPGIAAALEKDRQALMRGVHEVIQQRERGLKLSNQQIYECLTGQEKTAAWSPLRLDEVDVGRSKRLQSGALCLEVNREWAEGIEQYVAAHAADILQFVSSWKTRSKGN